MRYRASCISWLPSVFVVGAVQEAVSTPAWLEAATTRIPGTVTLIARNQRTHRAPRPSAFCPCIICHPLEPRGEPATGPTRAETANHSVNALSRADAGCWSSELFGLAVRRRRDQEDETPDDC